MTKGDVIAGCIVRYIVLGAICASLTQTAGWPGFVGFLTLWIIIDEYTIIWVHPHQLHHQQQEQLNGDSSHYPH